MAESTTNQMIIAEGSARGAIAEAKKMLLLQGQERFQAEPTTRQRRAMEAIVNLPQLKQKRGQLLTAASWYDLLPLAKSKPGRGRGGLRKANP